MVFNMANEKQKQDTRQNPIRTPLNRRSVVEPRGGMGKMLRNPLGTRQGVSTLKLVLMYSIIGMGLGWLLPIIIRIIQPEMSKDNAQYYGMIGAIVITLLFLVVSLLKGLILRRRTQQENSETKQPNSQFSDTKKPVN